MRRPRVDAALIPPEHLITPLRVADALQLGAPRTRAGSSDTPELVTYDERLALAARLEGFRVLPGG